MFFSFHEREKAYTQKKKALFYNLLYSSLLQIVFSVQYVNLHHQIRFHTSLPLITHHQPTSSHILGQKCSSQHSLRSSTSTPRGAASQHGTTGTHRNKLLLVGGLKATPFIEWWLMLRSAQCFPTEGGGNCWKVVLSPWSQGLKSQGLNHKGCLTSLGTSTSPGPFSFWKFDRIEQNFPGCDLCSLPFPVCLWRGSGLVFSTTTHLVVNVAGRYLHRCFFCRLNKHQFLIHVLLFSSHLRIPPLDLLQLDSVFLCTRELKLDTVLWMSSQKS